MENKIEHDKRIPTFLNDYLLEKVDRVIKNSNGLYNSRSHFIRCCIIKELNKGD